MGAAGEGRARSRVSTDGQRDVRHWRRSARTADDPRMTITLTPAPVVDRRTAPELPYGPAMTRALPGMHRSFLFVNRWLMVPALRAGLGPLFSNPVTGSLMILRTRGRGSGLWRDAPLGYVIRDGAVYCCAGFGRTTQWLRNIEADPRVEVVLPAGALAGTAEEVSDPVEWAPAMRALLASMGPIGRWTAGDVRAMTDDELLAHAAGVSLVRVRATGLAGGPFDPGGSGWMVVNGTLLLVVAGAVLRRVRGQGPSVPVRCQHRAHERSRR
jgi:deazaflavin-dependent oxidoreductase (nitroreductase family)